MKSKLWGGRFSKKTNPLAEDFTKSIQFDKKLAEYDCIGSLYHISILKKAALLDAKEYAVLKRGLEDVLTSIKKGSFKVDESFEDIHSYIQALMEKKAGKAALKLHTSRSRNDQVVFDTKYYCLANIENTKRLAHNLIGILTKLADSNKDMYMPGYTHLQHAMPVSLFSYFDAYREMIKRDYNRLSNAYKSINLTLGAGALSGTFIDSDKYNISAGSIPSLKLNPKPASNPIDAVSDRDFIIELLAALSIIGMHLSRLAEDLILWSTKEFDFIDIDESFCTGSSLMPQKKNPDVLELIRGYSGRLYGNLVAVLVTMKGLPLAYNRDMQLDKEPLFSSFEIVQKELKILSELLPKISFKKENIEKELHDECLYATDIVDYLVKKGVAFKDAHSIVGKLIRYKLKSGEDIKTMDDKKLKEFHPFLNHKILVKIIDPKESVRSKRSIRK